MNSDSQAGHKGTTASRSSKLQRRDRVRTVGPSLHPWGMTGRRYASERGEPTRRSATPSPGTHRPACHPISDTREASELSDPSPHRGALQPAQRWACSGGLRPAPKGCLAHGQPEHIERETKRESSPCLSDPQAPARSAHDAGNRGSAKGFWTCRPPLAGNGHSARTGEAPVRDDDGAFSLPVYTVFFTSLPPSAHGLRR
jgi:hypothetical protein